MSLQSFFSNIESAISAEWQKVKPALAGVWKVTSPMIEATAQEIGTIAMQAVAQEALNVLKPTGGEKFSSAVNNVISTLASQGKSIALSNAASAVQAAYNYGTSQLPATKGS